MNDSCFESSYNFYTCTLSGYQETSAGLSVKFVVGWYGVLFVVLVIAAFLDKYLR